MKKKILPYYEINRDTLALIPARNMDYYTIVIERHDYFYVRQSPLDIIKDACLEGGATYDGRRSAVIYKTGVHNRVPIPIDPIKGIFAFPTLSPSDFDCIWIFFHHVQSIKANQENANQSIITFKNQIEVPLNISRTRLENQMLRMSFCILRFSRMPYECSG